LSPTRELRLRTGAWYGDGDIGLPLPTEWTVETLWPSTPAPLTTGEIEAALLHPVGQPPIRELAVGKRRPVIVLDDLTRPTPAERVLPLILRQLEDAGIGREDVTIVVGGGTHRPAGPGQLARKVGGTASGCRVVAHDSTRSVVRIGRTSFGTPVLVNRFVAGSDLVLGIGGVYPQHSVGFGGGSKLILGVLGRRSIVALHYGHSSVAGTYDVDNDFRRDLDEVAELAGLRTMVSLHVDANRQVVRAVSGDHRAYYRDAVRFSREAFAARTPGDADVVIVNAYPMDVSLTFTRSKGMAPLYQAAPGASRVLVAACPEGLGYHGLFPFLNGPRFERQLHQLRRLSVVRPAAVPGKLARRASRLVRSCIRRGGGLAPAPVASSQPPAGRTGPRHPVHFHAPDAGADLPDHIPGLLREPGWDEVLRALRSEQAGKDRVHVLVYPCAALHCLQWQGGERTAYLTESLVG
jgi:nickel-dependent lactate racemase